MNRTATTPPGAIPPTIRARIHESAIGRVTRIYASTLSDVLTETLQNSRRAGATGVRIAVAALADRSAAEPRFSVTIADDGSGIADPAVLLSFGENGWSDDLVRREDAAGFGFASLSRRGCTVASRPRSPDGQTQPGWRVDLAPEHFLGEVEAAVHADDSAPFPHGTSISFQATETAAAIRHAAEAAARHYPLPVTFETIRRTEPGGETNAVSEQLERRAFLDGAVHAEPWRGLAFGVFRNRNRGYNDPDLNFFGLTLPVGLPTVETVHGGTWSVRTDIGDCPDLELVLPARKEAVENDFLKEMRSAARLAIYHAMAASPDPRPAFDDWKRARQAGIDIAPPPAVLRPWRPATAHVDDWREPPKLAVPGHGALVMDVDPEPPEAQAFCRAAERAGMATSLFETDRRLAGYDWYDGLDRVAGIATHVAIGGKEYPLEDVPMPERTGPAAAVLPSRPATIRPETIRMDLAVRPVRGPGRTFDLPADLVFAGEPWGWLGDAIPLVTAESGLQPHQLAELLWAGFFSPSDDADADSYETQRDRFDEEALHLATRLILSDEEACKTSIAEAVRRDLLWLAPRGRTVDIRIRKPDVTVTLAEAAEATS